MAVFSGNGSNTAPSFTFSSDTNTGMYRPDADKLALVTNGANRLFIDNFGQVAVGTDSPVARFTVQGPSDNTVATFLGSSLQADRTLTISNSGNDTNWEIRNTKSNGFLALGAGGATRVHVSDSGNLLVGGTLPGAPNATISSGGGISGTSFGTSGTLQLGPIFRRGLSGFSNSDSETRYFKIFELPQLATGFVIGKLTFYAARGGVNQQRAAKDFYFSVGYFTDGNVYSTIDKSAEGVEVGFTTMSLGVVENGAGTIATVRLALRSSTAATTPFMYATLEYNAFPLGSGASNVRYVFDGTYTTS